jgi:hypothetical protein
MTAVHAVCNLLERPLLTITITTDDLLYDLVNLLSKIALRVSVSTTRSFRWFFDETDYRLVCSHLECGDRGERRRCTYFLRHLAL